MQHINRENNKAPFFLKGVVSRKVTCKKKIGKEVETQNSTQRRHKGLCVDGDKVHWLPLNLQT